jgi:ABC-type oligopeptide transport system substrate-binding subunit
MRIFLSIFVSIAVAASLAGCGQSSSSQTQNTNATAKAANNNPADYLGALVQAKKSADKTIDVSYLNQALNQFNVQEGHYPKTLQELTPNYVAKIPDAPIGYKLDYDAVKGEVKVVAQ